MSKNRESSSYTTSSFNSADLESETSKSDTDILDGTKLSSEIENPQNFQSPQNPSKKNS